jgi:uncharacterized protein (TIGR03382 family)
MMTLLLSVAFACEPAASLGVLKGGPGDLKAAYVCLAEVDEGDDLLVPLVDAYIAAPAPKAEAPVPTGTDADMVHARATRALALWLLQRTDAQWDPALLRRLPAADRRLLADGVRARRGRASPSPDDAAIFQNFAWYKPDPHYTEGRLTAIDRANIAMADRPPPAPAPPPPPGPDEMAAVPPAEQVASPGWCGCATATGAGPLALLLAFAALLRRR